MKITIDKQPCLLLYGETDGLLKILKELFIKAGYVVCMTTQRDTFLDLLETQTPDVVVIDIVVYSNNILQILDLIRSQSNVPIVILSTPSDTIMPQNDITRDVNNLMIKPFRTRELLARVEAKLKRGRVENT